MTQPTVTFKEVHYRVTIRGDGTEPGRALLLSASPAELVRMNARNDPRLRKLAISCKVLQPPISPVP